MAKIAVIFCTWQRIWNFENTIKSLYDQEIYRFDIYVWNNNFESKNILDEIAKKYNRVHIHHSKINIGGIGRFYLAKKLANNYDEFILIDDDQIFDKYFVSGISELHNKHEIISCWAFKINNSYWNRIRITNGDETDYCGTGGMIIDSDIFNDPGIFDFPEKYYFVEDLWLSFFAKYKHGYKLKGIDLGGGYIRDNNGQWLRMRKLKEEFYRYLCNRFIQ